MSDKPPASKGYCLDPLSLSKKPFPISSVLRRYISQEGRDGPEYNVVAQAAEYIDQLERELAEARDQRDEWEKENSLNLKQTEEAVALADTFKQQRDMLAEALRFVVDDLDFEITERIGYSHHWCSLQVAREALAAVEGNQLNVKSDAPT